MRLLMTNRNYVTIMCILGCSLGVFNALMTQEHDSDGKIILRNYLEMEV